MQTDKAAYCVVAVPKHTAFEVFTVSCKLPLSNHLQADMIDRTPANDEERQLGSKDARRTGIDADRATLLPTSIAQPYATESRPNCRMLRPNSVSTPQTDSGQSLFLCIRGKRQTRFAIRVPCQRQLRRKVKRNGERAESMLDPDRARGFESDSKITERLVAACYQFHGKWKKYIPYYGIIDVQEVEVMSSNLKVFHQH